MSDFEDRLSAALADGSEGAPLGAGLAEGLADGARGRARVRRRRRVSLLAVAAVVAVVVPGAVVLGGHDAERERRPEVTEAGPGWKSVELGSAEAGTENEAGTGGDDAAAIMADVPEEWVQTRGDSCQSYPGWAPPGEDPCYDGVRYLGEIAFDSQFGPGLHGSSDFGVEPEGLAAWSGYVDLPDGIVTVAGDDRQVALRVLGSVRREGQEAPDLAGTWPAVTLDGLSHPLPPEPAVSAVVVPVSTVRGGAGFDRGTWTYDARVTDQLGLRVSAPTLALAQVVAGSATTADAGAPWQTVTHAGIEVDVPPAWDPLDPTECDVSSVGPADVEVGLPRP